MEVFHKIVIAYCRNRGHDGTANKDKIIF